MDLIGSIGGVVAFALLSFAHAPPVTWGVVAGVLLLVLVRPSLGIVQVVVALITSGGGEAAIECTPPATLASATGDGELALATPGDPDSVSEKLRELVKNPDKHEIKATAVIFDL